MLKTLRRVPMNKILVLPLLILALNLPAQHLSEIGLGWTGTSVNTVIFRKNSLVTHKGVQYTSYYDSASYLILAKRSLMSDAWEIKRTPYKGNIYDAHNSISIMVDGHGYLHVSWDHHGSKLRYCRSTYPGSLELTPEMPMTEKNEQQVTYPEFYRLNNGDLLFLYREGVSGGGNLVLNRYHTNERKWYRVHNNLINGEGKRNAYWQACVDDHGVFHVSWVWRESSNVESNHDLCYASSSDNGNTWKNSSGKEYTLPISIGTAERILEIPEKSELINTTSMTADENGFPYIACYWRRPTEQTPQYHIVFFDGRKWRTQQTSDRKTPFTLSGVGTKRLPVSRPQIILSSNYIYVIFRDAERQDRASVSIASKLNPERWRTVDLADFSLGQWEPSFDTELWKDKKQLHLFIQNTGQGDGERVENRSAQPVNVLEVDVQLIENK